jgi:FkbH-like protein
MLVADPSMDRTVMYHEKRAREAMLAGLETEAPDEIEMFAALGLKLHFWLADTNDISRATELINRTNQFNMCASRTTFQKMSAWQAGKTHSIYLASMADKFGDMGTVSVLVCDHSDENQAEIIHFVLSCRVFGYGVEQALLNRLKRDLASVGKTRLVGKVVPTDVNGPCQSVYSENGFVETNGIWVYSGSSHPIEEDPAWLGITSETDACFNPVPVAL